MNELQLLRSAPPTRRRAHWCAALCFLVSCVGCDQLTKQVAISRLKGQPPASFCRDVVRLQYAENPGAFLGLGGQMPGAARWLMLVVVNGAITVAIAGFLVVHRTMSPTGFTACAFLLAGALGNLIDRVRLDGLVVDFLNLGVGPVRTGIFNVADVAITSGAMLLAFSTYSPGRPSQAIEGPGSPRRV